MINMSGQIKRGIPRPGRLFTVKKTLAEAARVYRDARTGAISMKDGTSLIYILANMTRMIEQGEIEQRLDALEEKLKEPKP
ncbi:hypothetical protein OR1_03691 [Geobacter sp. OR-1]|nr:hypothetical protein OR1_03691 [Geobacter sp. OR-1]